MSLKKLLVLATVILLITSSGCLMKKTVGKQEKLPRPQQKPTEEIKKEKYEKKERRTGYKEEKEVVLKGSWIQLNGLDGGDMHFVYSTSDGILFDSHGFGGVWRSEDGGRHWEMIKQENFVDLTFYDMEELDGKLYAGTNKGLWFSEDKGKTWTKIATGYEEIDNGKYHVVTLAKYGNKLLFTTALGKIYRKGKPGYGKLLYYENGLVEEISTPENREIFVEARYPYIFLSSPYSGLYYSKGDGKWVKILDKNTTSVYVDEDNNLYVGTIKDWWYIGLWDGSKWEWKHIVIPGKTSETIFHFIVPDPVNKYVLWFGCGGASKFYSYSARGFGNAFVGVGCWDRDKLISWKTNPNYATSIAFYGTETVSTPCGKATKVAFVTVGGQAVRKTEDGGLSWNNSYEGICGDTINAISVIKSGILSGAIVVTAVSGNEIALDHGDRWMEDVDFSIGEVDGKLPGYSWCTASPDERIKGKYDLVISTGYPSPFGGDGVFGVNLSCVKGKSTERKAEKCVEKLISGPHYDVVIVGNKLYAGSMENGVDVLDLDTLTLSKIDVYGKSVPIIKLFDGKLFFETYESKYIGDCWKWCGKKGKIYVYDGNLQLVFDEYAMNFFVKNKEFIALVQDCIIYKQDYSTSDEIRVKLPSKKYTDMAVDWEDGLVFLSTDGEGVFYVTIDEVKSGTVKLKEFNKGLLTLKIRNIVYDDGYLFAGTRGHSVWRVKVEVT